MTYIWDNYGPLILFPAIFAVLGGGLFCAFNYTESGKAETKTNEQMYHIRKSIADCIEAGQDWTWDVQSIEKNGKFQSTVIGKCE